uniref:Uncharacterized protein n=1 Tax=Megaselia scalaris TaxID=36166 RepID=T1GK60_MEGSC
MNMNRGPPHYQLLRLSVVPTVLTLLQESFKFIWQSLMTFNHRFEQLSSQRCVVCLSEVVT